MVINEWRYNLSAQTHFNMPLSFNMYSIARLDLIWDIFSIFSNFKQQSEAI